MGGCLRTATSRSPTWSRGIAALTRPPAERDVIRGRYGACSTRATSTLKRSPHSRSTAGWTPSLSPRMRCATSCRRPRHGSEKKLNHADLVALIEGGVGRRGGRWADLGAGEGAFTRALTDVLGPEAHIVAVDKDAGALRAAGSGFETRVADFTKPLDLHDLDGVLMANSLHFVRDKEPVLKAVRGILGDADTLAARLLPEAGDPTGRGAFLLLGCRAQLGLRQGADDHDLVVLNRDFHPREPAVREPSGKPTLDRTEFLFIHALHDYTVRDGLSSGVA